MESSPISPVMQITYVVLWSGLFLPAALLFHAMLLRAKEIPDDVSWALAKVFGLFGFAWIIAAPASAGLCELHTEWIRAVFVGAALLGAFLLGKQFRFQRRSLRAHGRAILVPEILFLSVFIVFTFIWSLHCSLGGGEKAMNFTFLNFFIRNNQLPPQDPWAAGVQMQYYYFGSFAHALWHRLGGIPSAVGYGLAVATNAATLASACYAMLRLGGLRESRAFQGALVCVLAGNAQTLWLVLAERIPINSDLFWKGSRVFAHGHFSEFPLWTYLFADLHAHNIGLALGITCAFFLLALMRSESRSSSWILAAFLGFSAGLTPVSNTWDVFMIIAIFVAVILTEPRRALALWPQLALAGAAALCTCAPFFASIVGPKPLAVGILRSEWVSVNQVLLFFGFPIMIVLCGALARLEDGISTRRRYWAASIFFLMMGLAYFAHRQIGNPFSVLELAAQVIPALLVAIVVTNWSVTPVARQILLASALLIFAIEFVVIFDRTITLFKTFFQLSVLLWLAALMWLANQGSRFTRLMRVAQVGIVCVSLASGAVLIKSILPDFTKRLRAANLDSIAPLLSSERDMGKLLQWMSANIQGFPRILDAWGAGGLGRVTMNLGFPDFAHWEAHTVKRGVPHQEILRRKELINEFYRTDDAMRAHEILVVNGINFFVVSETERRTYPEVSASTPFQKFEVNPQLFALIHREGGAALYAPQSP